MSNSTREQAWRWWYGFNLLGVWVYAKWNMPELSHACAMETIAMEALT